MKGPEAIVHHDTSEFCFLLTGLLHVTLGEQAGVQRPGELSVIPAGIVHSAWTEEEGVDECVVHLDHAQLFLLCGSQTLSPGIRRLDDFTDLRAETVAAHIGDEALLESLFVDLLQTLSGLSPGFALADPRILRAVDALRDDLSAAWSVDSLAKVAGMSPANFSRRFRELVGRSPLGYLLDCRVERAAWLMQSTKSSLADIAHQVGFRSSSRFSEAFQRRRAISPSEWRRAFDESRRA